VTFASLPLGHLRAQLFQLVLVDFGGVHASGGAHDFRGHEGVAAVARADVRDDGSGLPLHQRGEPRDFRARIRVRGGNESR
jgi:hypothetical protein